jgi:hypothetical protein
MVLNQLATSETTHLDATQFIHIKYRGDFTVLIITVARVIIRVCYVLVTIGF